MNKIPKDTETPWAGRKCWVYANFYGRELFDIVKKVRDYKERWPAQGYDTHTYQAPYDTGNGYYHAVMKRYSTCS